MTWTNESPARARRIVRQVMQRGAVEVPGLDALQWQVLREVIKRGVPAQLGAEDLWIFELQTTAARLSRVMGMEELLLVAVLGQLETANLIRVVKLGALDLALYTVELGELEQRLSRAQHRGAGEPQPQEDSEAEGVDVRRCPDPQCHADADCELCDGHGNVPASWFCSCPSPQAAQADRGITVCSRCGDYL